MVEMGQRHEQTGTRRALGLIGVGAALAVTVLLAGTHALVTKSSPPSTASPGAAATSSASAGVPADLAAPLASGPAPTLAGEGGFPGDAEQQSFYLWAETHRVGSLNLPGMDPGGPLLSEVATRYCNMLFEGPNGSGDAVTRAIRRQTGAPPAEAREFLERSVTAFCPHKARNLV